VGAVQTGVVNGVVPEWRRSRGSSPATVVAETFAAKCTGKRNEKTTQTRRQRVNNGRLYGKTRPGSGNAGTRQTSVQTGEVAGRVRRKVATRPVQKRETNGKSERVAVRKGGVVLRLKSTYAQQEGAPV